MSSGVPQRFTGHRTPFDNDNVTTFDGQVTAICWSPDLGYFCAVGGVPACCGTLAAISPDGINWTATAAPISGDDANGIVWAPSLGLFAVVGAGNVGVVSTSVDGVTWTEQTTPSPEIGTCICWSEDVGLFVVGFAEGGGPLTPIMTSPDGVTWTIQTTPWDGSDFPQVLGIAWSATAGVFVATGRNSDHVTCPTVMTSPDGITWTQQSTPFDDPSSCNGIGLAVCWSDAFGVFIVAGLGASDEYAIMTSPDGVTWTLISPGTGVFGESLNCVIEADGVAFLGNERGEIASSLDLTTWVLDNDPWTSLASGDEALVYAFAYSPALNLVAAGAYGGFGTPYLPSIATCTPVPEPGIPFQCIPDWVTRATPGDGSMFIVEAICWSPDLALFCAVGDQENTGGVAIMTSPDGVTWTGYTSPFDTGSGSDNGCVCWSHTLGLFVLGGADRSGGGQTIATSPDGATWTAQTTPWDGINGETDGVAWSEDQHLFLAVGSDRAGVSALSSPDGITWSIVHTPFDSLSAYCVAYSPPLGLWAVGTSDGSAHGLICTSPDTITWTNRATPLDASFSDADAITWDDTHSKFYFLGFSNAIPQTLLSSSDGITWGVLHTPFDDDADYTQGLTTGNGWIVIGSNADEPMAIAQSNDGGETWLQSSSVFDSSRNECFAIAYSPTLDVFVAGGRAGASGGDPAVNLIATNTFPTLTPIPASARFYEAAPWRFVVADLTGATVTFLDPLALTRAITYTLGDAAMATCDLPSDNPEVDLNMDDEPFVTFNDKVLYCLRREGVSICSPWVIRFAGIIMQLNDEITADTDAPITHLTAYDPWKYLDSRPLIDPITIGLPGQNGVTYAADGTTTPAIIALDVLALSIAYSQAQDPMSTPISAQNCFIDSSSGHVPPLHDDTTPIDEAYNFSNASTVGDAWRQLMADGMCEITLTPVYPMDPLLGALCRLDIWQQAGDATNNDAIFSWDLPGRSLVGLNRLQDGTTMANHVSLRAGSAGALVPTQFAIDSTEKFGPYWYQTAITGKLAYPTLVTYLAQAQLKLMLQGVRTITIDPAPEQSPIPLVDYKLGDYVPLYSTNAFRQAIGPGPVVDGKWTNTWRITIIPITIPDDAPETVTQLMLTQPSGNI